MLKYEYDINATTSAIYSKSSESTAVPSIEAAAQPREAQTGATAINATVAPTAENRSSNNSYIGLEREAIALSDVRLSVASVTFTEAKSDFDDGVPNYYLDFYTATHEYDYEINALTGAIMDKSVEVNEHAVREMKPAATEAAEASLVLD